MTGESAIPALDGLVELELGQLRETFEDDNESISAILSLFADQCPSDIARITTANGAGDHKVLRESLHRLKGTASGVGAQRLYRITQALEREAYGRLLSPAEMDALSRESDAVVACVRTHLAPQEPETAAG